MLELMRSSITDIYQVDKVVIDEAGFAQFANTLCPGSYQHQTRVRQDHGVRRSRILTRLKVDFLQLDTFKVKPLGVYGSSEKLVELLATIGCIDRTAYVSVRVYASFLNLMGLQVSLGFR